jgi:lipopolysaccharide transport system permease protein
LATHLLRVTRPENRRALRHAWDVLVVLVRRDQASRYRRTAMGVLWAVASPLLFLLVLYLVFGYILVSQIQHFASYLFIGLVAWTWLQDTVIESAASIVSNPSLANQPHFPIAVLPVATTTLNLINFIFALPVVVVVLAIEGIVPGPTVVALPLVMVCQFVLVLALAYIVAAVNVVFRDAQHMIPVLLQLVFFASGIFFDLADLPEGVRQILLLNPAVHLLDAYRAILLRGVWPDWTALALVFAASSALLALALRNFRTASLHFLEEI